MRKAPPGFVAALKRYDRNLRCRWSLELNKWVIEAKLESREGLFKPVRAIIDEFNIRREVPLPETSERAIQYRDMYYTVLYVEKDVLSERVIEFVAQADTKRRFKNVEEQTAFIENVEREQELKQEEQQRDDFGQLSNEAYDYAMVKQGSMSFMGASQSLVDSKRYLGGLD